MLVNLASILAPAGTGGYGVAAFNVFGWEDARAVIDPAEETRAPVILAASLDFTRAMPVELIAAMFRSLCESAKVRSACTSIIAMKSTRCSVPSMPGFTSVMYDGSPLSLADSI